MVTQDEIKQLGPGWIRAPLDRLFDQGWEPLLNKALLSCPAIENAENYTVDVKVHMLMPGQWPCIPNWHYDLVPRDDEGNQLMNARNPSNIMYLWISGHPHTVFKDERGREWIVPSNVWKEFTQYDKHKGTMCTEHTWRLFIRVAPREILPPKGYLPKKCLRKHSQVYLDVTNFTW